MTVVPVDLDDRPPLSFYLSVGLVAGSIIALGSPILSTAEKQSIASIRVYAGADGRATLYDDDGQTNAYKSSQAGKVEVVWNDAAGRLDWAAGSKPGKGAMPPVEVVR